MVMKGHANIFYLIKEKTDWIEINRDWMARDYEMQDWGIMAVIIFNLFLINFY